CAHLAPHSFPTRRSSDLSESTLSVDISRIVSSFLTVSPTFLCQRMIVASAIDSPIWGISISVLMSPRPLGFLILNARDYSNPRRSEEHTSELQSRENLVC